MASHACLESLLGTMGEGDKQLDEMLEQQEPPWLDVVGDLFRVYCEGPHTEQDEELMLRPHM